MAEPKAEAAAERAMMQRMGYLGKAKPEGRKTTDRPVKMRQGAR